MRGATKGEKAYITEYMILGEKSQWVKAFILKTVTSGHISEHIKIAQS